MKIFNSFLVMVVVAILWMLPISEAIYDFRTDLREDNFVVSTTNLTTSSVVLLKPVYEDDESTIEILSDLADDSPVIDSYTAATRELDIDGLSTNSTRNLDVSYLIDALDAHQAIDIFVDLLPIIWILILIAFPVVALVVIWRV